MPALSQARLTTALDTLSRFALTTIDENMSNKRAAPDDSDDYYFYTASISLHLCLPLYL